MKFDPKLPVKPEIEVLFHYFPLGFTFFRNYLRLQLFVSSLKAKK